MVQRHGAEACRLDQPRHQKLGRLCPSGPGLDPDPHCACLQPKRKMTSTRNVWPWSYLAPWMEDDMMQRQAARSGAAGTDPYDNGLFMPLRQFIEEPIVKDLLHNGAALQVRTTHTN